MNGQIDLYRLMPPAMRSLVASGYGHILRRRRYGPRTERLVAEALDRESWSEERWRRWQERRLAEILDHAATTVPFYREHWRRRRREGDDSSWRDLRNWPVLRKESIRQAPHAFLSEEFRRAELYQEKTSGSSGTPLSIWRSREGFQQWYALVEARWRRWYGVSYRDRWAIFGGRMVTPFEQTSPPFWVWNSGLNQLYMSIFHLKSENAQAYIDALRSHDVVHIYGYASSLATLAQFALEQDLEAPRLQVAVSNAEPLHDHQREAIERLFGCEVRNSYGMSEGVAAGSECEHGSLHLWPEVGVLEVLDDEDDAPVPPGSDGRLVCSGLLEKGMPLIRYEVGDRGALESDPHPCPCGRRLPRLARIVGRLNDNVLSPDGRRIYQVGRVFSGARVKEGQIIQETLRDFRVRVVPAEGYGERDEASLRRELRSRVGDVSVDVETVMEIERLPNGKFRGVINRVVEG